MRAFRQQAHKLQMDLSRHFPYVVPVDPLVLAKGNPPPRQFSNLFTLQNPPIIADKTTSFLWCGVVLGWSSREG